MSYESDGDYFGILSAVSRGWPAVIFGLIAICFWLAAISLRHDCDSKTCPSLGQKPVVIENSCVCVSAPIEATPKPKHEVEFPVDRPVIRGLAQAAGAELGMAAIRRGYIDEEILRRAGTIEGGRRALIDFLANSDGLPPALAKQVAEALADSRRGDLIYLGPAVGLGEGRL